MKKVLLMLVVMLGVFAADKALAVQIIGIEISVKKGTKEWNADRSGVECVGRGICEVTIKGGAIGKDVFDGTLGFTEKNEFALSFPTSLLQSPIWKETFANGQLFIGKDIIIGDEIRRKIKNCPPLIKAGTYRIITESIFSYVKFK